ncbi:hypothetical protein DEFR109230_05950 [Deinococcus frigens]
MSGTPPLSSWLIRCSSSFRTTASGGSAMAGLLRLLSAAWYELRLKRSLQPDWKEKQRRHVAWSGRTSGAFLHVLEFNAMLMTNWSTASNRRCRIEHRIADQLQRRWPDGVAQYGVVQGWHLQKLVAPSPRNTRLRISGVEHSSGGGLCKPALSQVVRVIDGVRLSILAGQGWTGGVGLTPSLPQSRKMCRRPSWTCGVPLCKEPP